ncbi:MAG: TIM barrel protein [Bacteroidales bacterium]
MLTSRRKFLQSSALTVTGIAFSPALACSEKKNQEEIKEVEKITALQLYSVRNEMRDDPVQTLNRLAEMGYTHVEHASYVNHRFYGWTAAEFKTILDNSGLLIPSGHVVLEEFHWDETKNDFTDDWKKTVENAAFLGQEFLISPSMDESIQSTYNNLMRFMVIFNKCGELCNASGLKFGYHNHDFEFSKTLNGAKIFDLIATNTDADKVVLQLDIGNMYLAGAMAENVINQYPGRFLTIHVKDMVKTGNKASAYESTVLGDGILEPRKITDLAKDTGTTLFVIEQEAYQGDEVVGILKIFFLWQ